MNRSKYNKKFIIGIAVALLVPLSFYVMVRVLAKDKIVLPPYYLPDRIETRQENGTVHYDTIYRQVNDLQFLNQFGETVYLNSSLRGKILAISFFHTGDTATANTLTRNMVLLQRAFRKTGMKQNDTLVHFLTVSSQPESDTPPVLRGYAEDFAINQDHWWLLTGDKNRIDSLWRYELGLEDISGHPPYGTIVLLDKERFVRGYYDGLDPLNLRTCANDIGWLALEKKRKK
jgi:protein SCO1/2